MGLAEKTVTITKDMIDAYRHATLDTNPLHEKCALGFQEEFLLENLAEQTLPQLQNHTGTTVFDTLFYHPIPSNSSVALEIITHFSGEINARIMRHGKIAVASTISYTTLRTRCPTPLCEEVERLERHAKEAHRQLDSPPNTYMITTDAALAASRGIMRDEPAYRALAVGLASAACLDRGKELILAESAVGNAPVYSRHRIIMLPNSKDLNDGDKVEISLSFVKQAEGKFGAALYAENQNKDPLFAGTLDLTFVKEKVLARLLR